MPFCGMVVLLCMYLELLLSWRVMSMAELSSCTIVSFETKTNEGLGCMKQLDGVGQLVPQLYVTVSRGRLISVALLDSRSNKEWGRQRKIPLFGLGCM